MTDSWKVSLPCTKAEAEALKDDICPLAWLDFPPVLMTSEADAARPDEWRLDAYFDREPTAEMLGLLAALAPSAAGAEPAVEKVEDRDWVTLSQQGLEPIRAGPLLRPHAGPSRRRARRTRSRSRSTPAAPSAPASTRRRPAA